MSSKVLNINNFLFNKFGQKVWKIPLNSNFSCPHRDEHNLGGCIFCDSRGSKAPWLKNWMSIEEQFIKGRGLISRFYSVNKYIAYFQSYTSTNAKLEDQIILYEKVLKFPDVVGIAISTRPDSVSDELINYLNDLNKRTFLWIELGAQSMFDKSLVWMNRGHNAQSFINTTKKLRSFDINVVGHLIFGLPCETKIEMLSSFKKMLATGINGYKIHPLHIIKDTKLASMYEKEKFKMLEIYEYFELIEQVFEITPNTCVVHRISADVPKGLLVAPLWLLDKNKLNELFLRYS